MDLHLRQRLTLSQWQGALGLFALLWSSQALAEASEPERKTAGEISEGSNLADNVTSESGARDSSTTGADSAALTACVQAFDSGQESRRAGYLANAHRQFATCAATSCPPELRSKCTSWLGDVERAIPSLVIAPKDPEGQDIWTVRVLLDGAVIARHLNGLSLPLDPGLHSVRLEHPHYAPVEKQVLIKEGEKNRLLVLRFEQPLGPNLTPARQAVPNPSSPPPSAAEHHSSVTAEPDYTLAYVAFGVTATGIVVGTAAGLIASSKLDAIRSRCESAAGCTKNDIAEGERIAHLATGAFIVAGVGAVTGTIAVLLNLPRAEIGDARIEPRVGPNLLGLGGVF